MVSKGWHMDGGVDAGDGCQGVDKGLIGEATMESWRILKNLKTITLGWNRGGVFLRWEPA